MKVSVIGGGSTYTPELVMGFLNHVDSFPLKELWLMDIDPTRLNIVGKFAQRIASAHNAPFKVLLTTDQPEAVAGSSYVITQLRVGQMPARRADEYLGLRHGLIGQETTGIGGLSKALRTIPVILSIAQDMLQLAPNALLANFTNPAGLVTQALSIFAPDVNAVGVCNVAITTKMTILSQLQTELGATIAPERCELNTLGLNHLTWHRGFTVDGEEHWQRVLQGYIRELEGSTEPEFPVKLIKTLQMIPNYYLQYYYRTSHKLAEQRQWPPSRAEEVMEVERDLLRAYADLSLHQPPDDLMKRGGAYYSTAAVQLLNAHLNNLGETHIVNVRQASAVPDYPSDWVMELPCKVDQQGIHPLPAEPLPDACFGLIAQVKSSELLTARAAVTGDRDLLYQAILAHPLGPEVDQVEAVMDDLLNTHRAYLPAFWK